MQYVTELEWFNAVVFNNAVQFAMIYVYHTTKKSGLRGCLSFAEEVVQNGRSVIKRIAKI
jgi:hypothetical protein